MDLIQHFFQVYGNWRIRSFKLKLLWIIWSSSNHFSNLLFSTHQLGPMQFGRCPIPIHHHHFRIHSVVVRILLLVILALESIIFWHRIVSVRISVLFWWPQVRSVVVVVVLSEDGKFRNRFWKSMWKTKTGRFLKYKWGWFRLGFVTRGQRVFSIVLLSEIFFEIFARIGILRCFVSNDEIESCLGRTIVRVLTPVVTVDRSGKSEILCESKTITITTTTK